MRYVCDYSGVTRVIEAENMETATEEMLFVVTGIRNFGTGHPVKVSPVLTDEIVEAIKELDRIVEDGSNILRISTQELQILKLVRRLL